MNSRTLFAVIAQFAFAVACLAQSTNSWIDSGSGLWDEAFRWSLGVVPTNTQARIVITNAANKTVILDATTVANNPGSMTISNLLISAPANSTNTLLLANTGLTNSLMVYSGCALTARGSLIVSNSALRIDAVGGGATSIDGQITLQAGASLSSISNNTAVGDQGVGQVAMSSGTFLVKTLFVGNGTGANGNFSMAGGTSRVDNVLFVGNSLNSTGSVLLSGGLLTVTNSSTGFGSPGNGRLVISNATMLCRDLTVARNSTLTLGTSGTLVSSNLSVQSGSTAWLDGGQLFATNGPAQLQITGSQMVVSNGTVTVNGAVYIGTAPGSTGTLTLRAGAHNFRSNLLIGDRLGSSTGGSTGAVWVIDGQLTVSNTTFVGSAGLGQLTLSNGTVQANAVEIGGDSNSVGTITVAGGTNLNYSRLIVGNFACTATGVVNVLSGILAVTNSAGNAVLDVRSGMMTVSGGLLRADLLYITNACAHFMAVPGTYVIGSINLSGGLDADGDGMTNAFEQAYGLDPFDPNDAGNDPDGDGFTNLQELQAGTNPTNSASAFGITSVTRSGSDVLIVWQTGIGRTNDLERSDNLTNNFATIYSVTNTTSTTTNYTDMGVAAGAPAFYRVRLVQ